MPDSMPMPRVILIAICLISLTSFDPPVSAATPRVVVTIKPIHSLTSAILEGITSPKLLLDGASSPHAYALKPSDAEALNEADTIILVSKNLEVFLRRELATLPAKVQIIDLQSTPGLRLLPVRQTMPGFSRTSDGNSDHDHSDAHGDSSIDVHFWLDPLNAVAIGESLARHFSDMDPEHAAQYKSNAARLGRKLALLDDELRSRLAGLSTKPFIVFHDVTQYFEKRYDLHGLGSVTLSPERAPGAKHLAEIRAKIEGTHAICLFSEPQFPPKLLKTLTDGTDAKQGVLDEVGAAIPAGTDQYFALMRLNADNLANCLKA